MKTMWGIRSIIRAAGAIGDRMDTGRRRRASMHILETLPPSVLRDIGLGADFLTAIDAPTQS